MTNFIELYIFNKKKLYMMKIFLSLDDFFYLLHYREYLGIKSLMAVITIWMTSYSIDITFTSSTIISSTLKTIFIYMVIVINN